MFQITPSARLRTTPYHKSVVAEGCTNMTVYNSMLLPTGYGDPATEYWRLINGVSMWDVSVERQVQLQGPDAATLAQILSTRDLSKCKVGQGKYVALCNHAGTVINDPILLKLAEDKFWISIADADIVMWARGIAAERGLNVDVREADVSPLAVQGPKAEDVIADIFGDWVRKVKYFWFNETEINGIPVAVQRSGWSKQGGFEIYLMDSSRGDELWNIVKEAGQPYDIGPGNPNVIERIESGLLSFGGDTDDQTNPFEVRMGDYVNLDIADDVIGIQALRRIKDEGVKRHQLGVILDGDAPTALPFGWSDIEQDGRKIGDMTNAVWSLRLEKNIGFALVSVDAQPGDEVVVQKDGRAVPGRLTTLPFV